MKRYIDGIVYPVSPLNITAFDRPEEVAKMSIFTREGRKQIPYVPGNDIKGRMRRHAGRKIMDVVQPVIMQHFHVLTSGAQTAKPSTGVNSVEKLIMSRNDLYLGVFGGGPRLHRSAMQVRSMVPVNAATIALGQVPMTHIHLLDIYVRRDNDGHVLPTPQVPNCTETFSFRRIDDVLICQEMDAPELIEDYAHVAVNYEMRVNATKHLRKDEKAALIEAISTKRGGGETDFDFSAEKTKKNDNLTIFKKEAILPGTPLYLRIDFDDHLTDAQVFLAAESLSELFNEPFGGKGCIGFGLLKPEGLGLVTHGERTALLVSHGEVYAANPALPGCEECEAELHAYTRAKLDMLYPYIDEEALEAAQKEKKDKKSKDKIVQILNEKAE